MKIGYRLCLLCLVICCWTIGKGVGQNTVEQPLAFEKFFHGKMEKISGVLPVYREKMMGETHQDVLFEDFRFAFDIDFGLVTGNDCFVFVGLLDYLPHNRIPLLG